MEDLYKTLLGMESQPSQEIAYMLEKFIKGSASGIFNQQSNFEINNPLDCFLYQKYGRSAPSGCYAYYS